MKLLKKHLLWMFLSKKLFLPSQSSWNSHRSHRGTVQRMVKTQCNVTPTIHDYNTRQNATSACNAALCVREVSFLQLPVQHPTLLTKHTRQVHSHMSSTRCFVLIKSILPVEDEQDLLTPAGDKLFTAIFSVSCRKSVCSPGHQPSLTSYCYILAAWPPV